MKQRDDAARRNLFCVFMAQGFSAEQAVRRAGIPFTEDADTAAAELLGNAAIRRRLGKLSKELAFCPPAVRARAGLERIAFGGVNDAVGLLAADGDDISPKLDLFGVSEIKKPKGGGLEIKFFDRLRALSILAELDAGDPDGDGALLAALSGSVDRNGGEEDEQA